MELTILETAAILSLAAIFELDCEAGWEIDECGWTEFDFNDSSGIVNVSAERLVVLGLAERRYANIRWVTKSGYVYRLTLAGFAVADGLKVEVK